MYKCKCTITIYVDCSRDLDSEINFDFYILILARTDTQINTNNYLISNINFLYKLKGTYHCLDSVPRMTIIHKIAGELVQHSTSEIFKNCNLDKNQCLPVYVSRLAVTTHGANGATYILSSLQHIMRKKGMHLVNMFSIILCTMSNKILPYHTTMQVLYIGLIFRFFLKKQYICEICAIYRRYKVLRVLSSSIHSCEQSRASTDIFIFT